MANRRNRVALASAPIPFGRTHEYPVGGAVDGAGEALRIHKGFQQQQGGSRNTPANLAESGVYTETISVKPDFYDGNRVG